MGGSFYNWLSNNYIETLGAVFGIVYLWFSVKQNIWLWPVGLITSAFYGFVFFTSGFYADMALQGYYLIISVYGWLNWKFGGTTKDISNILPVTWLTWKGEIIAIVTTGLLTVLISNILIRFTDSTIPWWDAFTTAASIVATWMLTRKYIDNWIYWIVVDSISAGLYLYKGLYPTLLLFIAYTIMAIFGFFSWKKTMPVIINNNSKKTTYFLFVF